MFWKIYESFWLWFELVLSLNLEATAITAYWQYFASTGAGIACEVMKRTNKVSKKGLMDKILKAKLIL